MSVELIKKLVFSEGQCQSVKLGNKVISKEREDQLN